MHPILLVQRNKSLKKGNLQSDRTLRLYLCNKEVKIKVY
jgi:hypothetical protein